MPTEAFLLVLLAALLHATWNALVKGGKDPELLLSGMMFAGFVVTSPWLLQALPATSPEVAPYVAVSGLVETLYVITLSAAYARYDFSVVYPVARGSAPVWLAVIAALWLGERPSATALLGIAAIVAGVYVIALRSPRDPLRPFREPSAPLSLAVGLAIATYSAIDKAGLRYMPPLGYASLVFLATAVWVVPWVLVRRGARPLLGALREHWRMVTVVGALSSFTYALALWAFALAPVSYAGALRETSVVFGGLIGWLRLGEPLGARRTAAAAVVAAGAFLIARG